MEEELVPLRGIQTEIDNAATYIWIDTELSAAIRHWE